MLFDLSQVHIIPLLVEDGGAFTVAGEDLCVVGQMEQALYYAVAQGFIIASRHIGAADAAAEKRIAGKDPAFDFSIEADAAPCMTRRANHLQGALAHLDKLAVGQTGLGQVQMDIALFPKAQPGRVTFSLDVVIFHIRMCGHFDTVMTLYNIIAHYMVDMAMRVDNHQGLEAVAVDEAEEAVRFVMRGTTGIDDEAFFGVVVIDDVGVFRKRVENEGFEFEHSL